MLLRESGQAKAKHYELQGVTDRVLKTGVENEDVLLAYTDAFWNKDRDVLDRARVALAGRMGAGAVVEAAITVANFGMVDRIANSIGIPLDAMAVSATSDFRAALGIDQFPSARNTLPAEN